MCNVVNFPICSFLVFLIVLKTMVDVIYVILDAETGAASTYSTSNFGGTQHWKNQFQSF